MQSFHYLFGDQGVFVAGAVVDDEIDLDDNVQHIVDRNNGHDIVDWQV